MSLMPILMIAQETGIDAVVAPVKMNILYRGLENPLSIAVPGVTSDKVTATTTNGTIKRTGNEWFVSPGKENESVISVLVDNKKVSEKTFRVKNVPDPVAVFSEKNEGSISKETALKTDVLDVELKNFDWDLKFTITSFVMLFSNNNTDFEETSDGNKITEKMKSVIADCKVGQTIIFKDIKAIGPDGKYRELNPIVLKIK